MKDFFKSRICSKRLECYKCRLDPEYRERISKVFEVPDINFECPFGKVAEEFKDIQEPSLLKKVKNLIKTGVDVVNKSHKGVLVDEETKSKRLDFCNNCEWYKNNKCKKCGCRVSAKTSLKRSKCPLDPPKWDKV